MKTMPRVVGTAAAILLGALLTATAQDSASREDLVTTTAIVESVDKKTRQFLLTGENGRTLSLVADPEIRNFDQLEPGDRVTIDFYEAVAVVMADPGTEGTGAAAALAARAPEGEKPGLVADAVAIFTVEFVSYDPKTHVVTFIRPNGAVSAVRARPEMWDFASKRKSGDLVDVMIERAVAVSVEPLEN